MCPSGCDFTNIQQAIDSAPSGYTIYISAGVFKEVIRINGKSLRLQGESADKTVIDATGMVDAAGIGTVAKLTCSLNEKVIISSVTMTGGAYAHGGIGLDNHGCDVVLADSAVRNNGAPNNTSIGDGIANDGTLTLTSSTVASNHAVGVGGIWNSGTLFLIDSTVTGNSGRLSCGGGINNSGKAVLNDSTVVNNKSVYEDYGGGGICNNRGELFLEDSFITGNEAFGPGGGITNYGGTVSLKDSTIASNISRVVGGGGLYNSSGTVLLKDSMVDKNISAPYGGQGGGLFNRSGILTLVNSRVTNNEARGIDGGRGGGLYNESTGTLVLKESLVTNNTAFVGVGGDPLGGGLFNNGGFVSATETTIIDNVPDNCVGVNFGCP